MVIFPIVEIIIFLCFVVAILDLVHDVEAITANNNWKSFLKYE